MGCITLTDSLCLSAQSLAPGRLTLSFCLHLEHEAHQLLVLAVAIHQRHEEHFQCSSLALHHHLRLHIGHCWQFTVSDLLVSADIGITHLNIFRIEDDGRISGIGIVAAEWEGM